MTIKDDPYAGGDIKTTGDRPRPLDTLLKLDTYQGMTDDEIRLVVAYREYAAMQKADAIANRRIEEEKTNMMNDIYERLYKMSMDSFSKACDAAAQFEVVGR